jgi:IS5 family transposase
MSRPKKIETRQDDLFRDRLSNQLNPKHPLFILSDQIDWKKLESEFSSLYQKEKGHPPNAIRLMVGLMMLQHMDKLSDEQVVMKWVENPYYQYFCGYDHFQWKFPIHASSLTRWRHRLGENGVEKILSETIFVSLMIGHSSEKDLKHTIVDTTVMEKAIAHPTDSKLLNRAREKLVDLAKKHDVVLRQSYKRVGNSAFFQSCRYAHAGQYKRMKKQVKKLKTYLGRVVRDIERKITQETECAFKDLINKAKRLLTQEKDTANKLYSLHAPEVQCIAKGKANKRYEFGCKTSLVITHNQGLALSSRALPDNPYDGHTLKSPLSHAEKMSGIKIERSFVDRGYKKHGVEDIQVIMSKQKGLTNSLKRALKRRNAIEPHIGHMKNDGKLGRNYLKGILGDAINALMTGVGHNLRLIINFLRKLFTFFIEILLAIDNKKISANLITTR